jgi:hypothetical protein
VADGDTASVARASMASPTSHFLIAMNKPQLPVALQAFHPVLRHRHPRVG